jgi:hypothetical protein
MRFSVQYSKFFMIILFVLFVIKRDLIIRISSTLSLLSFYDARQQRLRLAVLDR